jgi:hypothetical protein
MWHFVASHHRRRDGDPRALQLQTSFGSILNEIAMHAGANPN